MRARLSARSSHLDYLVSNLKESKHHFTRRLSSNWFLFLLLHLWYTIYIYFLLVLLGLLPPLLQCGAHVIRQIAFSQFRIIVRDAKLVGRRDDGALVQAVGYRA